MHHPTDRITHTTAFVYTSRGALAKTRNSSMGPPHEGSTRRPIALPLSYVPLLSVYKSGCMCKKLLFVATKPVFFFDSGYSYERRSIRMPKRSLMVRWVVGSILHGVDPLSYFSFQPVLHNWCTKGRGMCYPVCGMVHIKEPLLLIDKSSLCGGSEFPFSLSEWSLTICLTPYNRK